MSRHVIAPGVDLGRRLACSGKDAGSRLLRRPAQRLALDTTMTRSRMAARSTAGRSAGNAAKRAASSGDGGGGGVRDRTPRTALHVASMTMTTVNGCSRQRAWAGPSADARLLAQTSRSGALTPTPNVAHGQMMGRR
jgi:hypothetical protein